jgi:hypothetical protein
VDGQPATYANTSQPRLVACVRRALACWLLCLGSVPTGAQISADLELSDTLVAAGQQVTVRIIVDHESVDDVELPEVEWGPHLSVVAGPLATTVRLATAPDARIAIEYRLLARVPGRVVVEPISLSIAGQVFETPPRLLEISEARDLSRVPFGVQWHVPVQTMVVGQVVPVTLELFNAREYTFPEAVTVAAPASAIFEEVQGIGEISRRTVDGTELLRIPIAGFMLTAGEAGTLSIPSAVVNAQGFELRSGQVNVPVTTLPAQADATGAVGDFDVSAVISRSSLLVGASAELVVTVRGTGNLHYLEFPDPIAPAFQLDLAGRAADLTPSAEGYRGEARFRYTLTAVPGAAEPRQPSGPRVVPVRFSEFAWFDPESGLVRGVTPAPIEVTVEAATAPARAEESTTAVALLDLAEIRAAQPPHRYKDPTAYGWFAPGVLILVGAVIFRRNRARAFLSALVFVAVAVGAARLEELSDRAMEAAAAGKLDVAAMHYRRMLNEEPHAPGVLHNLGVIATRQEDPAVAVFALREAIRYNPTLGVSRAALEEVERLFELTQQAPPPHRLLPDLFFFGIVGAVNLIGVVLAFARRPSGSRAIVLILLAVIGAASLAGLLVTDARASGGLAIVAHDLELRRIPEPDAQGWLPLPQGSALEIVTKQGSSVLLRSAAGLEGWAARSSLLVQGEDPPWRAAPHPGTL